LYFFVSYDPNYKVSPGITFDYETTDYYKEEGKAP